MTNQEIKEAIVDALFDRPGIWTKRVNPTEIRTRCPFCGDTQKRDDDGHFYININTEDNSPIVYHCFLCEAGDILKPSVLAMLDIDDPSLKSNVGQLNKTSDKPDRKSLIRESTFQYFPYTIPKITLGPKTRYIEDRLGQYHLSIEDFQEMKVVTSLKEFLIHNKIRTLSVNHAIANMIERDYVGFLSYGASHILFRDITNKNKYAWVKYPITQESSMNRAFYTMETTIDIFTEDPIIVNLSEGVMDTLSACYNLGYHKPNVLNVCVSGRYYDSIILFLVSLGIVGKNVTVNIFADNDSIFNANHKTKKSLYTTTLDYYDHLMKRYKYLFGTCNVYYNLKEKDIGRPIEDIKLKKYKL